MDNFNTLLYLSLLIIIILISVFVILLIIFQKFLQRKQEDFYREIQETQEAERRRIGKDLHDDLGVMLSSLKFQMDLLDRKIPINEETSRIISTSREIIDSSVNTTRTISNALMPLLLKNQGFPSAVQELVNKINQSKQISIDLKIDLKHLILSDLASINIFRSIQEMLNNSIKYSKSRKFNLTIQTVGNQLELIFKDFGVGFDPQSVRGKGIGLNNIDVRTKLLSGKVHLTSSSPEGVIYHIKFPISKIALWNQNN